MIKDAMKKLSQNTCLRFKPRTDEDDYVEITNEKNSGCMEPRIVMHELMHTTGLWHEHSREDRDQYIKVHLENVEGGCQKHDHEVIVARDGYGGEDYSAQFEKVDSMDASTYGVPYDYKSIMHYAKDFFAKPGTITMETIDPAYQDIIGTVEEPSKNDYKKICSIYNCEYCMELCYDQDPFQCLILSKRGDLDCNPGSHFVHFCCSTCRKNGGQTTTVPTTTEKVFPSTTPSQGCVDENPFMCKKMKEFNMLDCSANMESCCQTCKANEGPAHANYEEDPNTTQTLHSTTRFCYDENPSRCKRLARNNELNCRSKIGRRKCCRTCETHQDYFVVFG
ncbi:astacin [Ancylostoma ceylanicum]|uniref:Metalloendopeptidase n=1 Tax=Ancylostoma ceylanicum TaxID=53326 RepID=A0A0D6MBP6_9BILA|nr:astacin [Ancylostoma ceylanicum]